MRVRSIQRRSSYARLGTLALCGLLGGLAGCSEIQPVAPADAPVTEPMRLYMDLTLDHPAINLSTTEGYNTLQLTATPRDALGNAMPGLSSPVFESRDMTKARVTTEGLITAVASTNGGTVEVIATLTAGPVTHADTARVNITTLTAPPVLASLSIHPVPPDSAVWGMYFDDTHEIYDATYVGGQFYTYGSLIGDVSPVVTPRALDPTGTAIAKLAIKYTSLDPAIATVNRQTGAVTLVRPGQVRLVARTTAYGVSKADTAMFTVLPAFARMVSIYVGPAGTPVFDPGEVVIPPYGMVGFANYLRDSVDVVFDDPTNVVAGPDVICNDLSFWGSLGAFFGFGSSCGVGDALIHGPPTVFPGESPYPTIQARQFPVAAVYPFRSARTGATGRVVVTANPE